MLPGSTVVLLLGDGRARTKLSHPTIVERTMMIRARSFSLERFMFLPFWFRDVYPTVPRLVVSSPVKPDPEQGASPSAA
jgi:hypothetical protein